MPQLPVELFPIATTDWGALICIVLTKLPMAAAGSIVYWDYLEAWGKEGICYAIYPIAENFLDFIASIHDLGL